MRHKAGTHKVCQIYY